MEITSIDNAPIVHISGSGRMLGGAEKCLAELLELETKNSVNCLLITPDEGELVDHARSMGIPVQVVPFYPWVRWHRENPAVLLAKTATKFIMNCVAERKLEAYLKAVEPALVHINTAAVGTGFQASKRLGIPVVWHVRELCDQDSGRVFYKPDKQRKIIASSTWVVAVSKTVAKTLVPYARADNIVTVYDSVPAPCKTEREPLLEDNPIISIIGGIVPAKGQMDALCALAILADKGIAFKAVFAGEHYDRDYVESLYVMAEKCGLVDKVSFPGSIPEPYELLLQSDICLNCSKSESFGRVTVEGMLAGCLVIGRNTTGTAELLSEGRGLLFDTVDELAELLEEALMDADSTNTIANAGKTYAWQNFANVASSYRRIAEVFADAQR